MHSVHEAAIEIIRSLSASSEPEFIFSCWMARSRGSRNEWEIVREIYRLAATRGWEPGPAALNALVYAPLDNPALIGPIESDMERILNDRPKENQLRLGWRYVQCFSSSFVWQQIEAAVFTD